MSDEQTSKAEQEQARINQKIRQKIGRTLDRERKALLQAIADDKDIPADKVTATYAVAVTFNIIQVLATEMAALLQEQTSAAALEATRDNVDIALNYLASVAVDAVPPGETAH